ELLNIQRDRRVAESALARVLGLNRLDRPLLLRDPLPAPHPVGDETELLILAMNQRLETRVAADEVQQAEHELRLECWKVFPSIIAGFDFEQSERRALPGRKLLTDTARESIAAGGLTAPTIQS